MERQLPLLEREDRRKGLFACFGRSEIPLVVYVVIFSTMALLWVFQTIHEELTLGLFTELLGAAFTLFIIDTLLVRAKARRWKIVREHVDYLIARSVNRLRDGIATRVFAFDPRVDGGLDELATREAIREHRARFFDELEAMDQAAVLDRIQEQVVFTDALYAYFNEKAADVWEIINMKYSEYMEPGLVSTLMLLHTHLKDACAHIRQYRKADRFPDSQEHYHQTGRMGMSVTLLRTVHLLNRLKRQGYSETAVITGVVSPASTAPSSRI